MENPTYRKMIKFYIDDNFQWLSVLIGSIVLKFLLIIYDYFRNVVLLNALTLFLLRKWQGVILFAHIFV